MSRSTTKKKTKSKRRYDGKKLGWLRYGKFVVAVVVILIVAFCILVGVSKISGSSMSPTIEDGELVGYVRIVGDIDRWNIVYVQMADGSTYIKRVVAVEGDTVDIQDGVCTVNGKVLGTFGETAAHESTVTYPLTLQDGQVFVLGDNRKGSVDSRDFGPVSTDQIKGKILFHLNFNEKEQTDGVE